MTWYINDSLSPYRATASILVRFGTVMNKMLNNTISILLLLGGGVPEGGGGR